MSACITYSTKITTTIYHTQFQEVIRSIPNSDCSGQCEWHGSGRVMAGERHGNGTVCVNRSLKRQGNGVGTAWERHGMCELAFRREIAAARLLRWWVRITPSHGSLSVVRVVCCKVEVSATG
jgi:hypothetical protein